MAGPGLARRGTVRQGEGFTTTNLAGHGSARTKDAVLAAAIKRWPNVDIRGHDTADAMILAAIGCRYLGLPIDTVPKASWEPVMAKLNMMLKPRRRRIVNVELPERI